MTGFMETHLLEIEISTYNRFDILNKWLETCWNDIRNLGIGLAIYDSSTNDYTKNLIENINSISDIKIKYVKVDSEIRIDDKVLMSIMQSDYQYTWPIGDSRVFDINDIIGKVFPSIQKNVDFICLFSLDNSNKDGRCYFDSNAFFTDCFWHATLLGGLIFKKSIFDSLSDSNRYDMFQKKYYRNDGFSYLGIFYDLIAGRRINAIYHNVRMYDVGKNKTPGWLKRYLTVWCDNLCYLIDSIDTCYNSSKEKVLKDVWNNLSLDKIYWCYKARLANGLTLESYNRYDELGLLDRVTSNKKLMRKYITGNLFVLRIMFFFSRVIMFIRNKYMVVIHKFI